MDDACYNNAVISCRLRHEFVAFHGAHRCHHGTANPGVVRIVLELRIELQFFNHGGSRGRVAGLFCESGDRYEQQQVSQ
jgi:hypothetical protein